MGNVMLIVGKNLRLKYTPLSEAVDNILRQLLVPML